jgi:hypothetical protein
MFCYEFFPAYIWPWLNSVSIPCLAAMHATGDKAAVLTNLFGGSTNNEGLGLFTLSFDWQYVRCRLCPGPHARIADIKRPRPDHFLPDSSASEATDSSGRWHIHLLLGHAWHILQQRLGRKDAAFYVDKATNPRRRVLPNHEGICRWRARSQCLGQVWTAAPNRNIRLCHVHGQCRCKYSMITRSADAHPVESHRVHLPKCHS